MDKKDKKFDKFIQMLMHFVVTFSSISQLKTFNPKNNNTPQLNEGDTFLQAK